MLSVYQHNIIICKEVICFCKIQNSLFECKNRENCEKIFNEQFEKIQLKKPLININIDEMNYFAANSLNVKNKENKSFVIMSNTSKKHLSKDNLELIEKNGEIISVDLETIEKVGGGSARCMIAEIF